MKQQSTPCKTVNIMKILVNFSNACYLLKYKQNWTCYVPFPPLFFDGIRESSLPILKLPRAFLFYNLYSSAYLRCNKSTSWAICENKTATPANACPPCAAAGTEPGERPRKPLWSSRLHPETLWRPKVHYRYGKSPKEGHTEWHTEGL